MTTHYLIRHGQSTGNAGEKTSDPATIPLSELGKNQAQALVKPLTALYPQRIYCSPFTRTQETALPFLTKTGHLKMTILPIQEFTHLQPSRVKNTTEAERKILRETFWAKKDPTHKDGPNSESFNDLLERISDFISILQILDEPSALFGHGRFFTIFCLKLQNPTATPKKLLEITYDNLFVKKLNFPNAIIVPLKVNKQGIFPPEIPQIIT